MFDKIFSDKKAILELYNAIAQTDYTDESAVAAKRAVEECIKHGILKDILLKEKGVIEDIITVCYDEEIHKMREAEYNQELGEERGKEIGNIFVSEWVLWDLPLFLWSCLGYTSTCILDESEEIL